MSHYTPNPVPHDVPRALRAWLSSELRRISNAIGITHNVLLTARGEEPERPRDGMIVYADGASWDPGSGEGFYGRENGAWVKL